MAKRRTRAAQTAPPPDPSLGARLRSVPAPTWLFVALAVVMTALTIAGIVPALASSPSIIAYTVLGAIPTAIAFLLPAALFLRHRRVWTTDRLLVVGVVLFGVVEALQYASPGMSTWFRSIIPPPIELPFLAPIEIAFSVFVGILSALAPILTGRGLLAARAYEDEPRARRWWVVVAVLTLVAGVTNVLNLVNVGIDIPSDAVLVYFWLTVLTVAISLLSVFGWAYLAGVAMVGWRSAEEPGRGWGLAAVGGVVVLLGLAVSGVIATIGIFATPLPSDLSIGILASFALGYVLVLAAFLAGLPDDVDD